MRDDRREHCRQRILGVAFGYEDCNDADSLRFGPLLRTVCALRRDPRLLPRPAPGRPRHALGYISRIPHTQRWHVTRLGCAAMLAALDVRENASPAALAPGEPLGSPSQIRAKR
jgi:hypothetical protein